MTAVFEMDMFQAGGIEPSPAHPGLDAFRSIVEEWADLQDYDPESGLDLAENLVRLGSSKTALERTEERLRQVMASFEIDLRDSLKASRIGNVLRTLYDRHHLLPLSFMETGIDRSSYNAASEAVRMIAARGTREALETLLELHEDKASSLLKDAIMDSLETLAGRLGVRISKVRGRLEAVNTGS
jgi:hypothetical protein